MMDEQRKAKLSAALRAKWASGTRKKNPPAMYDVVSRKMREAYASGSRTWRPTRDICSKGGRTLTEKKLAKNREIGRNKIGKENPPGPSAKGVDHWKAKFWILLTPDRVVVAGVNLDEMVRRNTHLFDPKDLSPRGKSKTTTVAAKGLRGLFYLRKTKKHPGYAIPSSWKGWTAADSADMVKCVPDNCVIMVRPRLPAND